jgi:hypothetical protein
MDINRDKAKMGRIIDLMTRLMLSKRLRSDLPHFGLSPL